MPLKRMKELLDDNGIKYVTFQHSPAYTAQEIAQSAHISGKNLAKIVMLKIDDELAMAVVPASHQVNLESVKGAATEKHKSLNYGLPSGHGMRPFNFRRATGPRSQCCPQIVSYQVPSFVPESTTSLPAVCLRAC